MQCKGTKKSDVVNAYQDNNMDGYRCEMVINN